MSWQVDVAVGSAADFHARPMPEAPVRAAWVHEVDRPALVLGSTQPVEVADVAACEAAAVEVVRRRSGGGAVLLVPGEVVWIDLVLPRDDPLWLDDIGRAAHWVGRAWVAALGLDDAAVHTGGMVAAPWSALVCFAGVGPGEVLDGAGRKVVGISQRRTREGARFQCAALRSWTPGPLVDLLALAPDERARASAELGGVAAGVAVDGLADRLVRSLPD